MSREVALTSVSIDAAFVNDMDEPTGSLEVGKVGDVAMFDGEALDYISW